MKKAALVVFEPSGKKGMIEPHTTLLEAAGQVDQELRHVCGGNANCTTCRVRVVRGHDFLTPIEGKEARRLPDFRQQQGWRLACQARLSGPVVVEVPTVEQWIRLNQEEVHGHL